jgi:hypothetical protein
MAASAAALILLRRRAHRSLGPSPRGAARAFAELEAAMAARGHPRADHQTAREFRRSLRPFLAADERADVDLVVRLFERDRFSGEPLTEEDVSRALEAARRLEPASR